VVAQRREAVEQPVDALEVGCVGSRDRHFLDRDEATPGAYHLAEKDQSAGPTPRGLRTLWRTGDRTRAACIRHDGQRPSRRPAPATDRPHDEQVVSLTERREEVPDLVVDLGGSATVSPIVSLSSSPYRRRSRWTATLSAPSLMAKRGCDLDVGDIGASFGQQIAHAVEQNVFPAS